MNALRIGNLEVDKMLKNLVRMKESSAGGGVGSSADGTVVIQTKIRRHLFAKHSGGSWNPGKSPVEIDEQVIRDSDNVNALKPRGSIGEVKAQFPDLGAVTTAAHQKSNLKVEHRRTHSRE